MSKTVELSATVNIRVPSGHTVMAESQAAVRERVGNYISGLLAGLGMPGTPKISWSKQPSGSQTVEVSINGNPARLRYTTANSPGMPPAEFSVLLCEDILRNRLLFIGPEVVRYISGQADEPYRQWDEKGRDSVARTLIAQGFGLQRLRQFVPPADAAINTPQDWAETCIGDIEATQFVMHAHPSQIDPDDDPHDFNRLIESAAYFVDVAFKIKGIPFPQMRGEKRSDFAPNEMALQVNDLIFPAYPIGDIASENLRFVNFLTANGALFLNRGSVNFLLDSLEPANPNLLALVRSRFTTDFITAVLRKLAAENISVRPLVRILEILVSGGQDVYRQQPNVSEAPPLSETVHLVATDKRPDQLDMADWPEFVRLNLKNAIINRALPHFDEPQTISCFYLENALFEKITRFEALASKEQETLLQSLHRQIAADYLTPAGKIRPLITSAAWRKKISDLIAFEFPETPVFSLQECLPRIVARYDKMISI
ncbi:MAG: hypothetical protein DYG98_27630 [Haliscomenobacteraceae bacterium CHB4]|nr:hypothetical protein [Saprospiraceae bacterium]MCE7926826.1 hypothetical protein [Haliscomenobacteraceae bacterium CHB4]